MKATSIKQRDETVINNEIECLMSKIQSLQFEIAHLKYDMEMLFVANGDLKPIGDLRNFLSN